MSEPTFTFLGCYSDRDPYIRNGRDREEPRWGARTMNHIQEGVNSLESCNDMASTLGYKYFAMQHNHDCFASNEQSFDHYSQEPDHDCYLECTGTGGEGGYTSKPQCGGAWRNAVYETKDVSERPSSDSPSSSVPESETSGSPPSTHPLLSPATSPKEPSKDPKPSSPRMSKPSDSGTKWAWWLGGILVVLVSIFLVLFYWMNVDFRFASSARKNS